MTCKGVSLALIRAVIAITGGRAVFLSFFLSFFFFFVAERPSNMLVYLRDGSAQTVVRAATLR